jgi:hypothetical protein
MLRFACLVVGSLFLLAPLGAWARDTEHLFPAEEAKSSDLGQARLLDVPFYMKGQKHPKVKKTLSEVNTDRSTRGAFRSDSASCQVAFLSALLVLQQRAMDKGGNAIIDIVSTTRGKRTESATEYRCLAGTVIVHVGLRGKIVTLAK